MPRDRKGSSPFDALRIARIGKSEIPLSPLKQPAEQSDVYTARQLDKVASGSKSTDPEFMKFTTYIRKATHRAVKTRLVSQGRELSDLVEELMANWLHGNSPNNS